MRSLAKLLTAAVALAALAACASHTTPAATSTPAATPAATSSPAQPETAAGAVAAAQQVFELYAAQQYATVYTYLAPGTTSQISQPVYVAAHQQCISPSAGLSYQVTSPVVTGPTAVVTVSLAGAASALASESVTLDYSAGRWLWMLTPAQLSLYRPTAAATVAAMKAAGECSS